MAVWRSHRHPANCTGLVPSEAECRTGRRAGGSQARNNAIPPQFSPSPRATAAGWEVGPGDRRVAGPRSPAAACPLRPTGPGAPGGGAPQAAGISLRVPASRQVPTYRCRPWPGTGELDPDCRLPTALGRQLGQSQWLRCERSSDRARAAHERTRDGGEARAGSVCVRGSRAVRSCWHWGRGRGLWHAARAGGPSAQAYLRPSHRARRPPPRGRRRRRRRARAGPMRPGPAAPAAGAALRGGACACCRARMWNARADVPTSGRRLACRPTPPAVGGGEGRVVGPRSRGWGHGGGGGDHDRRGGGWGVLLLLESSSLVPACCHLWVSVRVGGELDCDCRVWHVLECDPHRGGWHWMCMMVGWRDMGPRLRPQTPLASPLLSSSMPVADGTERKLPRGEGPLTLAGSWDSRVSSCPYVRVRAALLPGTRATAVQPRPSSQWDVVAAVRLPTQ